MSNVIAMEGLDKAEVLAALYNASKPLGMGFLQYDPEPMTTNEARSLLAQQTYFDYLKGRVMKVDLGNDDLNPRGYDRNNGEGAAAKAINALRGGDEDAIREMHKRGIANEAKHTTEILHRDSVMEKTDGTTIITLGLSDVANVLGPAITKALDTSQEA